MLFLTILWQGSTLFFDPEDAKKMNEQFEILKKYPENYPIFAYLDKNKQSVFDTTFWVKISKAFHNKNLPTPHGIEADRKTVKFSFFDSIPPETWGFLNPLLSDYNIRSVPHMLTITIKAPLS